MVDCGLARGQNQAGDPDRRARVDEENLLRHVSADRYAAVGRGSVPAAAVARANGHARTRDRDAVRYGDRSGQRDRCARRQQEHDRIAGVGGADRIAQRTRRRYRPRCSPRGLR